MELNISIQRGIQGDWEVFNIIKFRNFLIADFLFFNLLFVEIPEKRQNSKSPFNSLPTIRDRLFNIEKGSSDSCFAIKGGLAAMKLSFQPITVQLFAAPVRK